MRTLKLRLLVFLAIAMPVLAHAESIVVVVNPGSGVDTLSRNEVINIFLGSFRQLPSGIAALPIDLPPGHPARAEFYRLLVGKNPAEINTYWARLIFSGKTRPPIQAQRFDVVADFFGLLDLNGEHDAYTIHRLRHRLLRQIRLGQHFFKA